MTEKDLLLALVESQKDTNKLMTAVTNRWTIIVMCFAIAFSVFIIAVALMTVGIVDAYFYSDYDYPSIEQSQTIEGVDIN